MKTKLKKTLLITALLSLTSFANAAGGSKMDPQTELGCRIYMCLYGGGQALAECQAPLQTYYTLTSNEYTKAYGESLPYMCAKSFL